MKSPDIFEISLNGKSIRVERQGDEHTPVFYIHFRVGPFQVQMETDAGGKEHWRQLPGGETELARQVGIAIEDSLNGNTGIQQP